MEYNFWKTVLLDWVSVKIVCAVCDFIPVANSIFVLVYASHKIMRFISHSFVVVTILRLIQPDFWYRILKIWVTQMWKYFLKHLKNKLNQQISIQKM